MSSLTDAQRNFIPHVLEHVFPETAAIKTGLDEQIAKKWMIDPSFRHELDRQRKLAAQNVMWHLERYANKAIATLVDLLADTNNENVRIKAADAILTHTIEFRKLYGIEERIDALEQLAGKAKEIRDGKPKSTENRIDPRIG